MKPYTFTIETDTPARAIQLARNELAAHDGYLGHDAFRAGKYAGRWRQIPGGIEVTLTDKPFLVPVALVESKVREYFSAST